MSITTEHVVQHLGPGVVDDHATLARCVAAVNTAVMRWHGYRPNAAWASDHVQGAIMLAAKLYRRRNSPNGVETFTELGPVMVQRSDPDIAMLLGLGAWTPPRVG